MLTQEEIRRVFSYKDGKLFWNIRPGPKIKLGSEAGSQSDRYWKIKYKNKSYSRSVLVWLYHNDYRPRVVEHRDTNKNNDKIENLRPATQQQNMFNRGANKGSTSEYKGVSKNKSRGKPWKAEARVGGKYYYLGLHETEIEAAKAYDKFTENVHGEYGVKNV